MQLLSFLGIIVHTLMLSLTTDDFQQRGIGHGPMTDLSAFIAAVSLEHIVIFIRLFIDYKIPDVPDRVKMCQALDDFEEKAYSKADKDHVDDWSEMAA